MNFSSKLARIVAPIVTCLMLLAGVPTEAQNTGTFDIERIQRATVFIMQARNVGDNLIVTCVGSGTLVSRDGLILTNAHNTVPNANCPGDTLIVALSIRFDEPPVPRYRADIVQADNGLDLALLRITRQSDGRLIEADSLSLPFVELGDSSAVELDETLTVVGYPGLADDPVAVERGTVVGFTAEPSGGDKSWIKTSAAIRGTMSGGGAFNQFGQLVGIPTTAPLSATSPDATCVTVQDTNLDGAINLTDSCIPIGGFINSLRPASFAQPLLRAASLRLTVETVTAAGNLFVDDSRPTFRYLGFSPSVNEAGMPTTIIRNLPTGSTSLYLFFDYENMTSETIYELRVTTDGIPNPTFSLPPVRWSGGRRGLWYVGSAGQPYPNGLYDFTLFINGNAAGNARLQVGGGAETVPEFTDIVFGILDLQGNVQGNGYVLPTGSVASARFLYRNIQPGTPWTAIWYYEGNEVQRLPEDTVWLESDGQSGIKTTSIQDPNGLLPGNYRLELYINARLATVADFTLAGAQDGAFARIYEDLHFTTADTPAEAVTAAPISTFSAGTDSIYMLFDWQQIAPGTLWTIRWSVDGDPFFRQTIPWNNAETGQNYLLRLSAPGGVPDGTYTVDLFINQRQFDSAQARVGIGQLPIDRLAQASGISLSGRVLDGDTNEGLAGVTVFIISELYNVSEFTELWSQEQLFATAITDRNGRFQVERPLQRDVPYSAFVLATGYLPVAADGVSITPEFFPTDAPIDVTIYLTRG